MISKNQIKFVRQLEQKKFRKKEHLFVAEGPKVVGDLLRAGFKAHSIFATNEWSHNGHAYQEVSEEELRKVSFLQHPQAVLAVFEIPNKEIWGPSYALPIGLALLPSIVPRVLQMHGTRRSYRRRWVALHE